MRLCAMNTGPPLSPVFTRNHPPGIRPWPGGTECGETRASMKTAAVSIVGICAVALSALAYFHFLNRPSMPVFPPAANNLARIELADLVALALPPKGFQNLAWDSLSTEPTIAWQTQGVALDGDE